MMHLLLFLNSTIFFVPPGGYLSSPSQSGALSLSLGTPKKEKSEEKPLKKTPQRTFSDEFETNMRPDMLGDFSTDIILTPLIRSYNGGYPLSSAAMPFLFYSTSSPFYFRCFYLTPEYYSAPTLFSFPTQLTPP